MRGGAIGPAVGSAARCSRFWGAGGGSAGGAAVGWAFQLQDPRLILLLLLLVTAIALGLAGLFRLPMIAAGARLTRADGRGGALFTGALRAAPGGLACSPGRGRARVLPFLLRGVAPASRRLLPTPGRWMETFQRILSLP